LRASIIIPVKNSKTTIFSLLESVQTQDPKLIEEIIVVENGSREITAEQLEPFRARLIQLDQGNRSAARNEGAKQAKAPILIFLDADITLANNWMSTVMSHLTPGTIAVQTPIIPSSGKMDLLQKIRLKRALRKTAGTYLSMNKKKQSQMVLNTAAVAIAKPVFEKLAGFDHYLSRHEDLDLTQRLLREEGEIKLVTSSSAQVWFDGNFLSYLMREYDQGVAIVRYYEKWDRKNAWESIKILAANIKQWLGRLGRTQKAEAVLELVGLTGNAMGVLKKIISPYPGPKFDLAKVPIKAKVSLMR
jgi:glycosyltransferase involved in cell wall biosynthesis